MRLTTSIGHKRLSRITKAVTCNRPGPRNVSLPNWGYRAYSSVVSPKASRVIVPVRSSGTINLEIHPPIHPSPTNPIILYLPRGGCLVKDGEPEIGDRGISSLVLGANATVVHLQYRLSTTHQYPTPIHDTLAGYDWVLKHLAQSSGAHNGWQSSKKAANLGVCGELSGGSLAAALALTECHAHRVGVKVAALGNPISDWTQMHSPSKDTIVKNELAGEEAQLTKKRRKTPAVDSFTAFASNATLPASSLLAARTDLFDLSDKYFDPFASPLLFFRTASSDLPYDYLSPYTSPASSEPEQEAPPMGWIRKRRAHRRHPPMGSDLRIPKTRIDVGEESVLRDQGWDLVDSMRRSVDLYEQEREFGAYADDSGVRGEQRVALKMRPGAGLWTDEDLVEVGRWMGEMLR